MRFITFLTALLLTAACASSQAPSSGLTTSSAIPTTTAPRPTTSASAPAASDVCHGLAHVYNPGRLHVLASCLSVRGVIISVRQEPDGDLHVLLRVDADQRDPRGSRFTNAVNDAKQGGNLVLEPVCEGPVIQPHAVGACAGYRNPLVVPALGSHVVVTGPWVLDAPHGWLEIHPLEKVEVLP